MPHKKLINEENYGRVKNYYMNEDNIVKRERVCSSCEDKYVGRNTKYCVKCWQKYVNKESPKDLKNEEHILYLLDRYRGDTAGRVNEDGLNII